MNISRPTRDEKWPLFVWVLAMAFLCGAAKTSEQSERAKQITGFLTGGQGDVVSLDSLHEVAELTHWLSERSFEPYPKLSSFVDVNSPLRPKYVTERLGVDENPIRFRKITSLSFEKPKTNISSIAFTQFGYLRGTDPKIQIRLTLTSTNSTSEPFQFTYIYDRSKRAVLKVCLEEDACVPRISRPKSMEPRGFIPEFEPTSKQMRSSGFDQVMEAGWKGKLKPVTVMIADSGVDYNHPLIQSHLPNTKMPQKSKVIERLIPNKDILTSNVSEALESEGEFDLSKFYPRTFSSELAERPVWWGMNYIDPKELPYDSKSSGEVAGHGTAVASIAVHGSQKIMLTVAKLPLKPNYNENLNRENSLSAFINEVNPGLINFSFGSTGRLSKEEIENSIALFENHPQRLFFLAAGNGTSELGGVGEVKNSLEYPNFPSGIPTENTVSVGSWDSENESPARFSNPDKAISDFLTPGVNARCLKAGAVTSTKCFLSNSGTSLSNPWALNVAAKVLMISPHLSGIQVRHLLVDSLDESGKLDARKALILACRTQAVDVSGCVKTIKAAPEFILGGPAPLNPQIRDNMKQCGLENALCDQHTIGYALDFDKSLPTLLKECTLDPPPSINIIKVYDRYSNASKALKKYGVDIYIEPFSYDGWGALLDSSFENKKFFAASVELLDALKKVFDYKGSNPGRLSEVKIVMSDHYRSRYLASDGPSVYASSRAIVSSEDRNLFLGDLKTWFLGAAVPILKDNLKIQPLSNLDRKKRKDLFSWFQRNSDSLSKTYERKENFIMSRQGELDLNVGHAMLLLAHLGIELPTKNPLVVGCPPKSNRRHNFASKSDRNVTH